MTAPPPADPTAAALTQGHEMSAQRLLRRYRNLLWLTVAPVFVLLVLLAQWQGLSQYTRALDSAAADARAHSAAIDAVVAGASDHVLDMQRWAERELARAAAVTLPDAAIAQAVRPRVQADGSSDGYTLDSLPDFIRRDMAQLLWVDTASPTPTPQALALLQSLSAVMDMAHLRNPDLAWSYLFGWPQKYVALYPWMPSRDMAEALGQPSLRASMDVWYGYGLFTGGVPERNSAHLPYWSAPYVDADSYGLMVSRAAPLYHGGEFRGVVGADLKLEALERLLQRMPGAPWQAWIVDDAGRVVADRARPVAEGPASVAARLASAPGTGARLGASWPTAAAVPPAPAASGASVAIPRVQRLADRLPAGVQSSDIAAAAADGRPQTLNGHQLVALHSPGSPWTLVLMAPTTALWLDVLPLVLPYLLIAAVLLLMLLTGQSMLQRRIIVPALGVMGYLQQLAQDDRAPEPYLGPRWQPWVLTVTQTFRSLRESLQREQRSEAFKTAVVDHALAAIVTTDAEGLVVEWNPAATAMFGVAREQALGRAVSALIVPPRHRDAHAAGMQRVRHGGEQRITGKRVEMSALRADGSEFPIEMVLSRTEVDGVTHYSAFINDVSERRDAAQQIERQREALRQSEKLTAMGSLLAGVAHELNNPLAIVMGRASLLEEKCEQQPALKADAVRIREAAERCGRIVRTFLNMARSKPAQRSSVSLNDLARAAADMLGYTYRSHSIELQLALADHLPPVHADGDQIGQVVLNLLVNAQQALAAHEGERRVRLSTGVDRGGPGQADATREPHVWLRVADSGAGVQPGVRERIFEPFFTTKAEGLGTGLGLAVSRSLAREHGGDLVLEAAEQGGAGFVLALPLGRPGDDERADAGAATPASVDAPASARILVVDDEAEITQLIRTMLESAGHEVSSAESGAVALEMLDMVPFDAIVSDLRMPDMDGAALWREVSARHPRLAARMLFVTGDTLSPGARAFLAASKCAALDKPFSRADLLARVAALLD